MELSIFVEGLFQMSDYRIHFKFRLHGPKLRIYDFIRRPESVQNESIICAAMRLAAAISFVPVLRNTTRRTPFIAGGVNRTCQSLRPGGGWWR
jgi:hypothetical protein